MTQQHKHGLLNIEDANKQIAQLLKPVVETVEVELKSALGKILAQTLVASFPTPPYDNSAMDGFAFNHASLENGKTDLKLIGQAMAGHPFAKQVNIGEAVRIMTGAKIPQGCDTVVMQEKTEVLNNEQVSILHQAQVGENIRYLGEDLSPGDTILEQGKKLSAVDLAFIASQGIAKVFIKRQLRVAFFSTGDELKELGEALDNGQIYDANRYAIYGLLSDLGCELIDMGIIPDDRDQIKTAFYQAAEKADVVITSGGVSVGDADYVKEILEEIGNINFWKVAMKPGKPLACGFINQSLFFGLPGNPVAVIATFYQIVKPALLYLMGEQTTQKPSYLAISKDNIRKRAGRTEFQRGVLSNNKQGQLEVSLAGGQGSHLLASMSKANCFIVLANESGNIEQGNLVEVQPFYALVK